MLLSFYQIFLETSKWNRYFSYLKLDTYVNIKIVRIKYKTIVIKISKQKFLIDDNGYHKDSIFFSLRVINMWTYRKNNF